MKNISPFLIFAIYLSVILIAESYAENIFILLQISEYRSEKISYFLSAFILIIISYFIFDKKNIVVFVAIPSKFSVFYSLIFCCALSIAGLAMMSSQILITHIFPLKKLYRFGSSQETKCIFGLITII